MERKTTLNLAVSGAAVALGFFTANQVLAATVQAIGLNWTAAPTWPLCKRICDHWLTPASRLLQAMGDLQGARPYFERALAILTARLGPDHPHTQTVRRNLDALADTRAD
jgi:hypothetical protein